MIDVSEARCKPILALKLSIVQKARGLTSTSSAWSEDENGFYGERATSVPIWLHPHRKEMQHLSTRCPLTHLLEELCTRDHCIPISTAMHASFFRCTLPSCANGKYRDEGCSDRYPNAFNQGNMTEKFPT